ncbi:hypothetical protein BsWGS_28513 [Bradybaena similaris]
MLTAKFITITCWLYRQQIVALSRRYKIRLLPQIVALSRRYKTRLLPSVEDTSSDEPVVSRTTEFGMKYSRKKCLCGDKLAKLAIIVYVGTNWPSLQSSCMWGQIGQACNHDVCGDKLAKLAIIVYVGINQPSLQSSCKGGQTGQACNHRVCWDKSATLIIICMRQNLSGFAWNAIMLIPYNNSYGWSMIASGQKTDCLGKMAGDSLKTSDRLTRKHG